MRILRWLFLAGAPLLVASAAVAHHPFSEEFDKSKPVKLRGTVTKMQWINPHAWIYIDVKGSDGRVVNWAIEGGAPNALFRRGFRENSLPVGAEILIEGFRARNGTPTASGKDLTFPDGRRIFVGALGTAASEEERRQ